MSFSRGMSLGMRRAVIQEGDLLEEIWQSLNSLRLAHWQMTSSPLVWVRTMISLLKKWISPVRRVSFLLDFIERVCPNNKVRLCPCIGYINYCKAHSTITPTQYIQSTSGAETQANDNKPIHRQMHKIRQANLKLNPYKDKSLSTRKDSTLRDIHRTLAREAIRTDYDTLHDDEKHRKPKSRARSRLDDNTYLGPYRETLKRTSLSPGAPINIFISMDKLSKEHKRGSCESIDKDKRRPNNSKARLAVVDKQLNTITSTSRRLRQNNPSQIKHRSIDHLHYYSLRHDIDKPRKSIAAKKPKQEERLEEGSISEEGESKETGEDEDRLVYQELKQDYNRFPNGFKKFKLIGRGGFSLVWLGYHMKTKASYAVKQILTRNKYQTHLKEIWFCTYFFRNGKPRKQFQRHPGADNLLMMFDYDIGQLDTWIVYEMCDGSLGSMLYNIFKSESPGSEDYNMKYKGLYLKMRENSIFLRQMIVELAKALDLLEMSNIVHSDIKTENILLKEEGEHTGNYRFKLIDYGSSFSFSNLKQYTLATPEYMCPELLNYILFQNGQEYDKEMLEVLRNYENVSAIDVWGLGCVILQIIHGVPLWVSNPTKISHKGKDIKVKGLFASDKGTNRSFGKIIQKQMQILKDIDLLVEERNYSEVIVDQEVLRVLKGMLEIDPAKRMHPREIAKILGCEISCNKFSLLDV